MNIIKVSFRLVAMRCVLTIKLGLGQLTQGLPNYWYPLVLPIHKKNIYRLSLLRVSCTTYTTILCLVSI